MCSVDHEPCEAGWNPPSLLEHFSALLEQVDKRHERALADLQGQLDRRIGVQERERADTERHLKALIDALKDAVSKAEMNMDKRLDALNALRQAVEVDRAVLVRRDTLDSKIEALHSRINQTAETLGARIDQLEAQLDRRAGREHRVDQLRPWHIWLAGAALTAVIFLANVWTSGPG